MDFNFNQFFLKRWLENSPKLSVEYIFFKYVSILIVDDGSTERKLCKKKKKISDFSPTVFLKKIFIKTKVHRKAHTKLYNL